MRRARRCVDLAPDAAADVGQEVERRVGGGAVERLLFDQAQDPRAAQQRVQHARLARLDAIEHADRFDAAQDVFVQRPDGRLEGVVGEELDGGFLPRARDQLEAHAVLADVLLLRVVAADDRGDVIHLERPLAEQAAVDFFEVREGLAGFRRRRRHEHRGHALEVLQAERRGQHGVLVADRFGQFARIGAGRSFSREAQPRGRVLLARPFVQRLLLGFRRGCARNRLVSPHRRPLVVGTDLRDQVLRRRCCLPAAPRS